MDIELREHPGKQFMVKVDGIFTGFLPFRKGGKLMITRPLDEQTRAEVVEAVAAKYAEVTGVPINTVSELESAIVPDIQPDEEHGDATDDDFDTGPSIILP